MNRRIIIYTFFVMQNYQVFALQPHLNTEDTDHQGTDWIISVSTSIAGLHKNIGEFRIEPGVSVNVVGTTVTVPPWTNSRYGSVQIYASTIHIDGNISATGAGYQPGGL